jgi:hypothetical protein
MKKVFYTIIFTAVLSLLTLSVFAQVDTIQRMPNIATVATQTAIAPPVVSPDQFTMVLGGLLDILSALGVSVGGYKSLILILGGLLWRIVEKTRMKTKHANEIENIAEALPKSRETIVHISKLREIINRLRGIKQQTS